MVRRYARARKGKRALGTQPCKRGKNVTIIGAIALKGLVAALTFEGGTTGLAFLTFVTEVLVPNLWKGACVIMDNFCSHKVSGIAEAIHQAGAKLIYLPPYSPDYSPIEQCWSKVKAYLRRRCARTYQALDEAITEACATISTQDIQGWFTHCGHCIASN